jgi:SAM-dependent methyltransferase
MESKTLLGVVGRAVGLKIPMIQPGPATNGTDRAERYWTAAIADGGIATWMSEIAVRRAINERVTGSPDEWPMEWFQFEYSVEPFELGLSVGCGGGSLERDVRRKGVCEGVVGMDISRGALMAADRKAQDEGLDGISYFRADFNRLDLEPNSFDVVFFHQSMHHVAELEHCIGQVRRAMKPGAFLYLDEYIGPSRDQWASGLLTAAQRVFSRVPREFRVVDDVSLPIVEDDPSEAIRSSEILPLVAANFDLVERRDYGGNLLSLIHPLVRWAEMDDGRRALLLRELIRREDRLVRSGVPSFYSVIVARR